MPSKKKVGIRLHAITVRFTPALWALSVWIPMVPFLGFLKVSDPVTWFATFGFLLPGLVFIYDALTILPEKGKFTGISAAVIMFALGAVNIFFSAMVWLHYFNPFSPNSALTPYAVVTLGLGIILLVAGGAIETYIGKRLGQEIKSRTS